MSIINKTTKKISKVFDSKLFPTFNTSSCKKKFNIDVSCSFFSVFNCQLDKVKDILSKNIIGKDNIVKKNGEIFYIKREYYKNIPDDMVMILVEYGLEKGIAYQVLRSIYSYKIDYVDTFSEDGYVSNKFFDTIFNINNLNIENINPLSTLYSKYAVFLEDKDVKTAIYAKEKEIPDKYIVKIKSPTPVVFSETYISNTTDKTITITVPNIYNEDSEYLDLVLYYEDSDDILYMLKENFAVTQIIIKDCIAYLTIDGLDVSSNHQTVRMAAKNEKEMTGSSEIFFKEKIENIGISIEDKISKIESSKKATRMRKINEHNLRNNIDDTPYILKIIRSKEIIHSIKKNKAE